MTGFIDFENFANPGNDLVGGRICGLVEIDDSVTNIIADGPFEGGAATGNWGEMASAHIELVIIFEEQRPFGGIEWCWSRLLRFDEKIRRLLLLHHSSCC